MLQAMRDRVMGVLGWIIIGLVIITFALFGLGSYLQDKGRIYAAKVNDVEITPRELQMAYQQQRAQMEQMLGDAYNPALLDDKMLRKRALETLISRQVLLQAAEANGMAISDQLLAASIQSAAVFQEDGKFSEARYQSLLRQQGLTAAGFEYDTRNQLKTEQLVGGLGQSTFISAEELNLAYSLQEQTRDFSYLLVSAKAFEGSIQPDEQQIQEYYDQHGDEFVVPERVRLAYVRLTDDALIETIEVSDADLEAYYKEKKDSLATQEQRRASHILVQVAADADEETVNAARAKAEDLLAKIRDGADFAELAKANSDDPGSAQQGGDLGFFGKGAMVPEFEASVFSLEPGAVSELVKTPFGFHIIKLVEIRGSEIPPLEQVRGELTAELQAREVDDLFYEHMEQLADVSYENPHSLDAVAEALGLEVQTSDWVTASGGPGVGEYPKLMAAVFSDDVLEAGNNSEPVEIGRNDVIVARVQEREAAHQSPLDDVKEEIVAALKQQLAAQRAKAEGEALLEKLAQGAGMDELKDQDSVSYKHGEAVKRSAPDYDAEVLGETFRLGRPADGAVVDRGLELANGDYAVIRLSKVTDGDPAAMKDDVRTQLTQVFSNMRRAAMLSVMIDDLRANAKIEIPTESE